MKPLTIAATLCAVLVHSQVHAATYYGEILGNGLHVTEFADDPVFWTGVVTVVTDGSGDGAFTGGTLERITVHTNVFDWSYTKGQTQIVWDALPDLQLLVGPEPGASVTVSGGQLAGIDLVYDDYDNIDTMLGLHVSATSACRIGICHGAPDAYVVSGALIPVPEAPASMMAMAGLTVLGAFALRRRDMRARISGHRTSAGNH